jgi:3-methyl-2-oxobutanoate hydroxymethyltransferase
MLTAYDYPTAMMVDESGVDVILVGDSVAMVVMGHETTVSITMDEMLHHCRAAARGARRALIVGDMPFMSYQVSSEEAVRNAGRFLKEAGMEAVKIEGGKHYAKTIASMTNAGIAVMGHIGLTPQSAVKLGGYRIQGKTVGRAKELLEDALAIQEAGCFAIVLEAIPASVAELITGKLSIPTIGIGSGRGCSGQVLVFHDLLGLFDKFSPKFVRQYANLRVPIVDALKAYCRDVESGDFPGDEHSFNKDSEELKHFVESQQQ